MDNVKCGACVKPYSDYLNLNMIAGTGMCMECNKRWLNVMTLQEDEAEALRLELRMHRVE